MELRNFSIPRADSFTLEFDLASDQLVDEIDLVRWQLFAQSLGAPSGTAILEKDTNDGSVELLTVYGVRCRVNLTPEETDLEPGNYYHQVSVLGPYDETRATVLAGLITIVASEVEPAA